MPIIYKKVFCYMQNISNVAKKTFSDQIGLIKKNKNKYY